MTIATRLLTVDRQEFKKWCEGVLLEFHNGKGIIVNERECEEAENALSRGEDVLFTEGGRLTGTKIVSKDDGYHEVDTDENSISINRKAKARKRGVSNFPKDRNSR